jgi:hypothetical protein
MHIPKLIILLLSFCSLQFRAIAQNSLEQSFDFGHNQISEGNYLKSNTIGQYQWKDINFRAGFRTELISASSTTLSGSFVAAERECSIKEFPFLLHVKYSYNRFSKLAHEQSAQITAKIRKPHWEYIFGSQIFRQYRISKSAIKDYNIAKENITEFVNLMYRVQYSIHEEKSETNWNTGIGITNIDVFNINQETNPLFYVYGDWEISAHLKLRADFWYKSSGALNISVNYFGYFFRTGLQWEIN